jgi:hypothetical protein
MRLNRKVKPFTHILSKVEVKRDIVSRATRMRMQVMLWALAMVAATSIYLILGGCCRRAGLHVHLRDYDGKQDVNICSWSPSPYRIGIGRLPVGHETCPDFAKVIIHAACTVKNQF